MASSSPRSPFLATTITIFIVMFIASSFHHHPVSGARKSPSSVDPIVMPHGSGRSRMISTDGASSSEPDLQFYAQVDTAGYDIAVLVDALDTNTTASFGQIQAFSLNVTSGSGADSQLLGTMHGYTVQTSSTSDSRAVEVEVLKYDDGAGVNGTISLQGLITSSGTTISVVGGTGSFQGVRGYDAITFVNATSDTLFVYHHSLYFL